MKLELLKQVDAPLLARKRVSLMASFDGKTPSNDEVKKEIASLLKTKEELVAIRHIYQRYGQSNAKIIAHVYDKVEDLKAIEEIKKKKVKKAKDEKPKETKEVKEEIEEEVKGGEETKAKEQKA